MFGMPHSSQSRGARLATFSSDCHWHDVEQDRAAEQVTS